MKRLRRDGVDLFYEEAGTNLAEWSGITPGD